MPKHVVRMKEIKKACRILVWKSLRKCQLQDRERAGMVILRWISEREVMRMGGG
jgi:hypothetical protein